MALSMYQPWAWLVAKGIKPLENRTPGFSGRNFRGKLFVHASQKYERAEHEKARALAEQNGFFDLPPFDHIEEFACGAIIGMVTVVDRIGVPTVLPDGWRMEGRFGLVLRDARMLKRPVFCPGSQGLFYVKESVLARCKEAA